MRLGYCILFFISVGGWAQTPTDSTLRTVETSKVEVVSRLSADDIQKWGTAPGTVILSDEIERQSPEDLGDLSAKFSGVFVRSYGGAGGLKTMNARGLGSQHFLVVNNQQALLFNQMGSANLGDVQVDGLHSVTYNVGGSDAWDLPTLAKTYSGVLQLKYFDLMNHRDDFAQVQVLGASFNRYKLSGAWLKSKDKTTFFAQAYGYQMLGDFPFEFQHGLVDVVGERLHNFTREASGRFGINHKFNKQHKLQTSVQYLNAFRELPGAIVFYHPEHFQTLGNQQLNGNLRHEYINSQERLRLIHFANFSQTTTDYRDSFHLIRPQWQHYQENNLDFGQNGQLDWDLFKLNWSGQYVFSALNTNRADIVLPQRHRALANIGGEFQNGFTKIRFDLPIQFVQDHLWQYENENRILFTPSLGVNRKWFTNRWNSVLRGSIGQFARLATFSEMYYGQMGNPDLRPEISQMLNLGFHHKRYKDRGTVGLGIDAFYGQIEDKIIAIPTQNLFVWSVRNLQTVRTYGFDAMFTLDYFPGYGKSRYNITHKSSLNVAADISNPEGPTYGHQIPYKPYWLHHTDFNWSYKKIGVTYSYHFNDFRFVLGENIAANVLPSFHLHDLRINYETKFKATSKYVWRFHVKCNNVFNEQYQVMRGFPMPGRNFELGVSWRM